MNVLAQKLQNGYLNKGMKSFQYDGEMAGVSDDIIIQKAIAENWILITNDKDFGEKVFRE